MSYTFKSQRYVTRGIKDKVSLEIQVLLWSLLDEQVNNDTEMDYLQCFDLTMVLVEGHQTQKIVHRQEEPERSVTVHYQEIADVINSLTVWIIDDEDHITMLLPSEY